MGEGLRRCLLAGLLAAPTLVIACGARTGLGTGGLLDAAVIDATEEEAAEPDASQDADGSPADAIAEETGPLPDAGPPVLSISTNGPTCVVQTKGNLKCWGVYQGNGGTASSTTATDIVGLAGPVVGVSLGPHVVYARLQDDSLQVWGSTGKTGGTLGLGISGIVLVPTTATDLDHQVAYAPGSVSNGCAVLTNGGVKCWGDATHGALGNGQTSGVALSPVDVVGLAGKVVTVGVGRWFSCAVLSSGAVQCWGTGWSGELGNGADNESVTPVTVVGITNAKAVACGLDHACALLSTGGVKCWGDDAFGQLGDGVMGDASSDPVSDTPVDVIGLQAGVIAISAGGDDTACALLSTGGVKCWGKNTEGQLGDGTTTSRSIPTDVVGLQSNVISVSAGLRKSCALMASGGAKCWGTDPGHRRQGLGAALVAEVARLARRQWPAAQILIGASPGNEAERIYRRLGFEPIEHVVGLIRGPDAGR